MKMTREKERKACEVRIPRRGKRSNTCLSGELGDKSLCRRDVHRLIKEKLKLFEQNLSENRRSKALPTAPTAQHKLKETEVILLPYKLAIGSIEFVGLCILSDATKLVRATVLSVDSLFTSAAVLSPRGFPS